ncbi:MAG: hypothetical protein ACREBG_03550 [Pyrinomonadaceae bacterium]
MRDIVPLILAIALALILAWVGWSSIGKPSPVTVGWSILGVLGGLIFVSLLVSLGRYTTFKPGLKDKSETAQRTNML